MLRAAAAEQAQQQAEHQAAYAMAQGQLRQAEQHLAGEAELQRQQRKALQDQAKAQTRELAHLQARLQQEREEIRHHHQQQVRVVREREESLLKARQQVEREREYQLQKKKALEREARRVGQEHAGSGQAWQEAQLTGTQIHEQIHQAEERGYQRGINDRVTVPQVREESGPAQSRVEATEASVPPPRPPILPASGPPTPPRYGKATCS
ncbi:unnamed protein product [Phytophthora fragariaefolia]|uniref:Unnamed protein product n=1 Tax=Phytophthora fragariaefolia TaxID=1490495 RepID=A0A9W6XFW3_9STRA|nr:unnamed protein product [Phytophthora fragariaefolia]